MAPESFEVNPLHSLAQLQMVHPEDSPVHWFNVDDSSIFLFCTWLLSEEAHGSLSDISYVMIRKAFFAVYKLLTFLLKRILIVN